MCSPLANITLWLAVNQTDAKTSLIGSLNALASVAPNVMHPQELASTTAGFANIVFVLLPAGATRRDAPAANEKAGAVAAAPLPPPPPLLSVHWGTSTQNDASAALTAALGPRFAGTRVSVSLRPFASAPPPPPPRRRALLQAPGAAPPAPASPPPLGATFATLSLPLGTTAADAAAAAAAASAPSALAALAAAVGAGSAAVDDSPNATSVGVSMNLTMGTASADAPAAAGLLSLGAVRSAFAAANITGIVTFVTPPSVVLSGDPTVAAASSGAAPAANAKPHPPAPPAVCSFPPPSPCRCAAPSAFASAGATTKTIYLEGSAKLIGD